MVGGIFLAKKIVKNLFNTLLTHFAEKNREE